MSKSTNNKEVQSNCPLEKNNAPNKDFLNQSVMLERFKIIRDMELSSGSPNEVISFFDNFIQNLERNNKDKTK